jgi:RNA polymerase sigma-70 factor (ECF subfamily)
VSDAPPSQPPDSSTHESGHLADQALALRARTGDLAALEMLVLRHQSSIASLLWKFARTRADLDDLVQDTFLRMVRGIGQWRAERPFDHWLRRIAANAGRDYCRRHAVRRRWMSDPAPATADENTPPLEAVDTAPDPAARAAASEAKELLAQLPPDDRALLTLFHLDGWDLPSIARDFGWTHAATKLRAWRARQRLRALLSDTL